MKTTLRVLGVLACVGLGGLVTTWLVLLRSLNGGMLETAIEVDLARALGLGVEIEAPHVDWTGGFSAASLTLDDPQGHPCFRSGALVADWSWPWSEGPWIRATLDGGELDLVAGNWSDTAPPVPPAPGADVPSLRLSRRGTMEVEAGWLLGLEFGGVKGRLQAAAAGLDVPLENLGGRLLASRDGRFRLEEGALVLASDLELAVAARGDATRQELELDTEPMELSRLARLPPLSFLSTHLGLVPDGRLQLELDGVLDAAFPPALSGVARLEQAVLKIGTERLAGPFDGSWTFDQREPGVLAGNLEGSRLQFSVMGFDLELRSLDGRLEVAGGGLRLSRLRARTSLGPSHLGLRMGWAQGFGWELALESGGEPGHWLSAARVLATGAGIDLQEAHVSHDDVDLVLAVRILPDQYDPPTWLVEDATVTGVTGDSPLQMTDLEGMLYLDTEGGHSFSLEGSGGVLRGQLAPEGDLELWSGPPGGPLRTDHLVPRKR